MTKKPETEDIVTPETFERLLRTLVEATLVQDTAKANECVREIMRLTDMMGVGMVKMHEQIVALNAIFENCLNLNGKGIVGLKAGTDSKGDPIALDVFEVNYVARMKPKQAQAYIDEHMKGDKQGQLLYGKERFTQ